MSVENGLAGRQSFRNQLCAVRQRSTNVDFDPNNCRRDDGTQFLVKQKRFCTLPPQNVTVVGILSHNISVSFEYKSFMMALEHNIWGEKQSVL